MMRVLIGCESSGAVRDAFLARGHDAWSCDLLPSETPGSHFECDLLDVIGGGVVWSTHSNPYHWDLLIAHPPCTYLTNAAAWALQDPDYDRWPGVGYHQRIKPGTLVGAARRAARDDALAFVRALAAAPIPRICIENPMGAARSAIGWPCQTIQPWMFGDDASKATGLSLKGLPPLRHTAYVQPRIVNGKPRWANQTDNGQNRLSPGPDRWKDRSRTYEGIAAAMALQWGEMT